MLWTFSSGSIGRKLFKSITYAGLSCALVAAPAWAATVERPPQFHGTFKLTENKPDSTCADGGTFGTGTSVDNRPVLAFGARDGIILLDDVDASDDICKGRLATQVLSGAPTTTIEQSTTYYGCKDKSDNGRVMKTIWTITERTFVAKNITYHDGETISTTCRFVRVGK